MKKLSTLLLALAFMFSTGASMAAGNFLQDYQQKRNEAIKKQDAKINEYQKKQEEAQKKREADKKAWEKKQQQQKAAAQQRQQQRKDAIKNLKDSFKFYL